MRNYLAAECYKTFRRKYFYIILAVCLGLEAVLLWGYWTTWKWGNSNVDRRYRILRAIYKQFIQN